MNKMRSLPPRDTIAKIQTNLKEMKSEVDSYLLRHSPIDLPPIIRARHYLLVGYMNHQEQEDDPPRKEQLKSKRKKQPKQLKQLKQGRKGQASEQSPYVCEIRFGKDSPNQWEKVCDFRLSKERYSPKIKEKSVTRHPIPKQYRSLNPESIQTHRQVHNITLDTPLPQPQKIIQQTLKRQKSSIDNIHRLFAARARAELKDNSKSKEDLTPTAMNIMNIRSYEQEEDSPFEPYSDTNLLNSSTPVMPKRLTRRASKGAVGWGKDIYTPWEDLASNSPFDLYS